MSNDLRLGKLIYDSLITVLRQGSTLIVGLGSSILLARLLGVEGRGIYALVILFPTVLISLLNGGIQMSIVYHVARSEDKLEDTVGKAIGISLWLSAITFLIGLVVLLLASQILFANVPLVFLLISLFLAPITVCLNNFIAIFRGIEDFRSSNLIEFIPQVAMLILLVVLVWILQWDIVGAIIAVVGGRLAATLFAVFLLQRLIVHRSLVRLRLPRAYIREVVTYGAKAQAGLTALLLNYRADVFILNILTNERSVAIYDLAVNQVESLWMLSRSVSTVMLARSSSLKDRDDTRRKIAPLVTRHVLWFGIATGLFTYVVAEWATVLLYGEEYRESAQAIRMLLPGIVTLGALRVMSTDVAGRGMPGINAIHSTIGAIINIVLNFVLIPQYDFLGAALATTISYTAIWLMMVWTYPRISKVRWYEPILLTRSDMRAWGRAIKSLLGRFQL